MHDHNLGNSGYLSNRQPGSSSSLEYELLSRGWKIFYREFDWDYFTTVVEKDTFGILKKGIAWFGRVTENLTRANFGLISNILTVGENTQREFDAFWDSITPVPPTPGYRHELQFTSQIPVESQITRNTIALEQIHLKLEEAILLKVLELLGMPTTIKQFAGNCFYYPIEDFVDFHSLHIISDTHAYWENHDIWLEIRNYDGARKLYVLKGENLPEWINKASYDLAAIKSGYQVRIGSILSEFPINSFPSNIQDFTDKFISHLLVSNRTTALIYGEPGTGKTAWTQAVAKELLVPFGYVVFVLDKDSVLDFAPPPYLQNVCLIVNECDNLAVDRSREAVLNTSVTEHVLSLLDGTLYNSVAVNGSPQNQRLVVLMTCNTTERLDPAMLRKGRVDFMKEFVHKFI